MSDVDEEKIVPRMDSCLLCANSSAVVYDCEGNVIKREHPDHEFSYEDLFSNLCHLLGFRKNSRFLKEWHFKDNSCPFPFCNECEAMLVSLSELYRKLSQLENEVKEEMRLVETRFAKERLYEKHCQRYYNFRKGVLGVDFQGDKEVRGKRIISEDMCTETPKGQGAYEYPETPVIQSQRVLRKRRAISISTPSPSPAKKPKKRKSFILKKQKATNLTRASNSKVRESSKRSKQRKLSTPSLNKALKKNETDLDDEVPPPNSPNDSHHQPQSSQQLKFDKLESHEEEEDPDIYTKDLQKKKKQHFSRVHIKGSNLKVWEKGSCAVQLDTSSGCIIYHTTHGSNRYQMTKLTVEFLKVDGEEGYKCASCLHVLLPTPNTKRTVSGSTVKAWSTLFYTHVIGYHTDRYRCKICPCSESTHFRSKTDLAAHLDEAHSGMTIARMITAHRYNVKYVESLKRMREERIALPEMSTQTNSKSILIERKRLKFPQAIEAINNLCPDCGALVKGGAQGFTYHRMYVHRENLPGCLQKAVCQICGQELSNKYALEGHVKRVHPDGKWKGPTDCRYPSCDQEAFGSGEELQKHIESEHGSSDAARKGVLCKVCGMVLAGCSWSLRSHMKVHTGQRSHSCHICPKAFPEKTTLKLHLAVAHQTGDDYGVFVCQVEGCGIQFPCDTYLRLHQRKKHGMLRRTSKKQKS